MTRWNTAAIRDLLTDAFSDEELMAVAFDRFRPVYDDFSAGMSKGAKIQRLIEHSVRQVCVEDVLAHVKLANPRQYAAHESRLALLPEPTSSTRAKLFICYKRAAERDQRLAMHLYDYLTRQGHDVFIDVTLRAGTQWLDQIDEQIKASDYLIVLLSHESADSEMVKSEVKRAYEYRKLQGNPQTLPVRVAYEGLLPYALDVFLNPLQYVMWQNEADDERMDQEIQRAVQGQLSDRAPVHIRNTVGVLTVSEDGRVVRDDRASVPPLPEFDPRFIETLEMPTGAVKLQDLFYIEREDDARLKREVVKSGTTTTVRAARQTGKSSLLARALRHAQLAGVKVVCLDLQRVGDDALNSMDAFLGYFAELIIRKLRLDLAQKVKFWRDFTLPQDKLSYLLEDYVLPASDTPIVLALDEADRLLDTEFYTDFFALIRFWHNNRAFDELWNKLNLVMVVSTEPYLLIADPNQSPFNVGSELFLQDFNVAQVSALDSKHGWPVKEPDVPQLMGLLNGHPYLTRKALYTMASSKLSWNELNSTAASDSGPFADHLRHHYWLLHKAPDLREALKQVIIHGRCIDEDLFYRLLRAGLVEGSGSVCQCRCALYSRYFKGKLG